MTEKTIPTPQKSEKKKKKSFRKWELVANWQYYILVIPTFIFFFMFVYMSMPGILLAFKRYEVGGIWSSPWVGLDNFKAYFTGPYFLRTTFNTLIINLLNLVVGTVTTVGAALLINEVFHLRTKKVFQVILYLPTFFSVMLVAKFVQLIFNDNYGLMNQLLGSLGMDAVKWNHSPQYWKGILTFVYVWKGTGNGLIVYLASIVGQDEDIYEAARLDGAGRWRQTFSLTLPLLTPTIIILTLMRIGGIFNGDFQMVYALVGTNSDLMPSLDIIETYLYRSVMTSANNYGEATAVALYQSVLGLICLVSANWVARRYDKNTALF